mgnify:CR=1 FL=1
MTTAVSMKNLCFSYDRDPVISHMDMALEKGTITAVLGANGVGKTTLLYLLLGLYEPDRGDILFFGKPGNRYTRGRLKQVIGMVSQALANQRLDTSPNKTDNCLWRQFFEVEVAQNIIGRIGNVRACIDQHAIKIEDNCIDCPHHT